MMSLKIKNTLYSILASIALSSCFGSGNEEAAGGSFGLKLEVVEAPELVPVSSLDNKIKVRLFDSANKAASNFSVIFTYSGTADLVVANQVVNTDVNGYAETTFRAPSQILNGQSVKAKVANLELETTVTFDVISAGPPKPTTVTFEINPQDAVAALPDMDPMTPFIVRVLDQYGKKYVYDPSDEDPAPSVSVEISMAQGSNLFLAGTLTKGLNNSEAIFNDIRYARAEAVSVRATLKSNGNTVHTRVSNTFTVAPAAPHYIAVLAPGQSLNSGFDSAINAITGNALSQKAGLAFTSSVYILDRAFNITTNAAVASYNVSFAPLSSANIISQGGAPAGSSNLELEPVVANGTFTVTASASFGGSPLNTIASKDIFVGPGLPNKLAIHQNPSSPEKAGLAFAQPIRVSILDRFNNVVTDATDRITIRAFRDTCINLVNNPSKLKNVEADAVNGIATFTDLNYEVAEDIYLQGQLASLPNPNSNCSSKVTIEAGTPSQLTWNDVPVAGTQLTAGSALTPVPKVNVADSFGNLVTTVANTIQMQVFSDSCVTPIAATTPSPIAAPSLASTSANTNLGVATFTNLRVNLAGMNYYIRASAAGGLNTTCHGPLHFSAGAANSIALTSEFPTTHEAHQAFSPTPAFKVIDQWGNTKTATGQQIEIVPFNAGVGTCDTALTDKIYSGQVLAADSGIASAPGFFYRSAGSVRFGARLVSNSAIKGCSANITSVGAGPAHKLRWVGNLPSPIPATAKLSSVGSVQIQVSDEWDNPVSSSISLTVTAHSNNDCSVNADALTISGVTALEGAVVTTNASGIGSFPDLAYRRAQDVYFKAVPTSISLPGTAPCSSKVVINPGAITNIAALSTLPVSNVSADDSILPIPQFNFLDTYQNIVKATSSKMTLTAKGAACSGNASASLENGVDFVPNPTTGLVSFNTLAYRKAETIGLELSTDAAGVSPTCLGNITVVPGAAKKLEFFTHPVLGPTLAGENFSSPTNPVRVRLTDNWNNPVTNTTKSVTISVFEDAACTTNPGAGTLGGTNPKNTASGVSEFDNLNYTKATTSLYLKAHVSNDANIVPDCSDRFEVKHNVPNKIIMASGSSLPLELQVTGTFATFQLRIEDIHGNLVNTGGPYTLNYDGMDATCSNQHYAGTTAPSGVHQKIEMGAPAATSSGGLFTVSDLRYRVTGDVRFKFWIDGHIASAAPGILCTSSVAMKSNTPTAIEWVNYPVASPNSADNAFTQQPQINVKDLFGNLITQPRIATLTAHTDTSCTNAATGTFVVTPTGTSTGVAAFTGVAYRKAESITLKASVDTFTNLPGACNSSLINVSPGAINKLGFVTQPHATPTAGVSLATQPRVKIMDQWNNTVLTNTETILFSLHKDSATCQSGLETLTPNGTDALSYSPVASVNGEGSTTNLKVNLAATHLYLKAYLNSDNNKSLCSARMNVAPAAPFSMGLASYTYPSSLKANINFPSVTTRLLDEYGNVASGTNYSIVADFYSDPNTCVTGVNNAFERGTLTRSSSTGLITFDNLGYNLSGQNIALGFALTSNTSIKTCFTQTVNIIPGDPAKIEFTQVPNGSVVAGTLLPTQPSVKITDVYGNLTAASENIVLEPFKSTNTNCSTGTQLPTNRYTYTGTPNTPTVNGTFAYTGFKIDETGTYRIKARSTTLTTLTTACSSAEVTITPSAATGVVVSSTIPASRIASQNFDLDALVVDGLGNVVNTAEGNGPFAITFYQAGSSCSVQAPSGLTAPYNGSAYANNTGTAVNGVIDVNGLAYRLTGDYQFRITGPGAGIESPCLPNAVGGKITIQAADPTGIEFPSLGASKVATDSWSNLTFTVRDSYGNLANRQNYTMNFEVFDSTCSVIQSEAIQNRLVRSPASLTIAGGSGTLTSLQMQRAGNWRFKATIVGAEAYAMCSASPVLIQPGAPAKIAWQSEASTGGSSLPAGTTLESLSTETMPSVIVTDTYGNTGTSGGAGQTISLTAYTSASCDNGTELTITNGNAEGNTVAAVVAAFNQTDVNGLSEGTSLAIRKSHSSNIHFKASSVSWGATPCSSTGILVVPGSLNFMKIKTLDGDKGAVVVNNTSYFNTDPSFWATGYDQFGNYRNNVESNWQLFYTGSTTPAPNGVLGLSNEDKKSFINSAAAGAAGNWKLVATAKSDGSKTVLVDPISLSLQTPAKLDVTISTATPVAAGAPITLQIRALDASDAVVPNFQGIKAVNISHNQPQSLSVGCGSGSGSNTHPGAVSVNFVNGIGTYTHTNGLKKAQSSIYTAAIAIPALSGSSASFSVVPAAHDCTNIVRPLTNEVFVQSGENFLNQDFSLKLASTDRFGNFIGNIAGTWNATGHLQGLIDQDIRSPNTHTQISFKAIRRGSGTITASAGGPLTSVNITTNDGLDFSFAASNTSLFNQYGLKAVTHYDTLLDDMNSAWRYKNTSWSSEVNSITRGQRDDFPVKALVVGTDMSLEILDAAQNNLWMRFVAGNNSTIDSTRGGVSAVAAGNGKVFAGLKAATDDRGSLVMIDFKRDNLYRLSTAPGVTTSHMFTGINSRNGAPAWSNSTLPLPSQLVVNSLAHKKVGAYEYLAVATKEGLLVYRIEDQFLEPGTDVFNVQYARHATTGAVMAADISSTGDIYYTVENTGVLKASATSITYTSDNSGTFTGTVAYDNNKQRASLTHFNFTSLDVLENSSVNAGYNLLALGGDRGVIMLHEGADLTSAQSHNLTYKGQGQNFFANVAEFDGVNDYISIPHKAQFPQAEGSLEFSFRSDVQIDASSSKNMTLFYRGAGGFEPFSVPGNITVRIQDRRLVFTYGTGDGTIAEVRTNRSQWLKGTRYNVRLGWIWNSATELQLGIWVNGSRDVDISNIPGGQTFADVFPNRNQSLITTNTSAITLGAHISNSSRTNYFHGALDELVIRNEVPNDDFYSNFVEATSAYVGNEAGLVSLFHFDTIWNTGTSTYNVAVDSAASNASNGTYVNGASSSFPILSGLSRSVTQLRGVPDASAPRLYVGTQFTGGSLSELHTIRNSSGTAVLGISRSFEVIGLSVFHVESASDSDIAFIERDQNLTLIRR